MTTDELKVIKEWFKTYIRDFADEDGLLHDLLKLKVGHSGRVARDARAVATDLDWSEDAVRMAEALGWLHDVGRFSQFKEFHTFHDAKSINHGQRGWEILQQDSVLLGLSELERTCILQGVHWHNAKDLPQDLDAQVLPTVQLIRDADKLDIFHVFSVEIKENGFQSFAKMYPHVKLNGPVSDSVVQDFQMCRSSSYHDIQSLCDFMVIQLAWVYDINFAPTFKRIIQRQIIEDLAELLPRHDNTLNALIKQAEGFVRSRQ
jgi:hypothetical protein